MAESVYIKVKSHDEKRWSFLTPKGGTTYLRIHAARYSIADGESIVREIYEQNTDFDAKMIPVSS